MDAFVALYLFMLAGIAGYVLIANVPSILHTPLLSGSNFIHGVVLAGAMVALGHAEGALQISIGFLGVMAATANVVGGYVVTDRMSGVDGRADGSSDNDQNDDNGQSSADSTSDDSSLGNDDGRNK